MPIASPPPAGPELSVVLPVFNEEASLPELHRRLSQTLAGLRLSFEILYVDDGSSDRSMAILRELAGSDPRVLVLSLSRNFGHQIALSAGLDHARGEAVVLMDSDLQDPPELIPELVARWREGLEVVHARRRARPGESAFKRLSAFAFYRLMRSLAGVDIPPDTGDFRLLSRRAADAVRELPERSRFLRGLVSWVGFREGSVLYERPARSGGESKYRLRDMLRLAQTGAFSFSRFPISLVGAGAAVVSAGAIVGLAFGLPPVAAALFFLGGVQLAAIWILGQYLAIAVEESKRRPLYLLRETVNVQKTASRPASEAYSLK